MGVPETGLLAEYAISGLVVRFLTVGVICTSLGLFVLFREKSSAAGRVFFIYTLTLGFWFVGAAMGFASPDEATALFWGRFAHHGVNLIPAAIYHFSTIAVATSRRKRHWIWGNWVLSIAFVIAAVSWPAYVGPPRHFEWGFYARYTLAGAAFTLYYLATLATVLHSYYAAYVSSRSGSSRRNRAGLLLIGFAVGGLGGLDLLPAFGVTLLPPIGDLPVLALVVISTYVTARYRLVEITPELAADRILETMSDALIVCDADGMVRVANDAAQKLFEEMDLVGRSVMDVAPSSEFGDRLAEIVESGVDRSELTMPSGSGSPRTLLVSVAPIHDQRNELVGNVCVMADVSEQRRYDELIRKSQKMESLGLMAGGVAHDFNNILTGIVGNVDLATDKMDSDSPARPYLQKAISGATRAAGLADQMLSYAGRAHTTKKEAELNEVVKLAAGLVDEANFSGVELKFELSRSNLRVFVDVAQVEQMIANVINNAAEAMELGGGTLTIWTDSLEVGSEYLRAADIGRSMPAGSYAQLVVADTGEGMDKHTVEKIFDPFFSTKFTGRGLGLAAVSGAVRAHDGVLKIESQPERGTSFSILFPLLDDA